MLSVTKRFRFEACHHLPHYHGNCCRLHGHSYVLDVTVSGEIINDEDNPKCGMIIDFSDLKEIVDSTILRNVDHTDLNDTFDNPTAEFMVKSFYYDLKKALPPSMKLVRCRLWETVDNYAEYGED